VQQKVSLVLSGGGARGIAHIGVIEELENQGFDIFSVSGTSMGALVGGVFALGKMEELKNWLFTLDKMKIFNLIDFNFNSQGLVKGDRVFNKMKEFISDALIEDLKIYYAAVASDIVNKKEVVFTSGSIFNAIRASIAIPTVFTPVKTENGLLVDGGIMNNIPINHAKRLPNDILVVVNVNADVPVCKTPVSPLENIGSIAKYQQKLKDFYHHLRNNYPSNHEDHLGYFSLITKTFSLMTNHLDQMTLENYSPDVLINISRESCSTFDFYRAEDLVEIGRQAAVESINLYNNIHLKLTP
jgi:NTE family protein